MGGNATFSVQVLLSYAADHVLLRHPDYRGGGPSPDLTEEAGQAVPRLKQGSLIT